MPINSVNFDPASAKRIARAVRDYERKAGQSARLASEPVNPNRRFWVQLQTENPDQSGQYQWKLQDFVQGTFQDSDPLIQDNTNYSAQEANLTSGLTNDYVEVEFFGYDTDDNPIYLFSATNGGPAPQFIYQEFVGVAQNSPGWRQDRYAPIIPNS